MSKDKIKQLEDDLDRLCIKKILEEFTELIFFLKREKADCADSDKAPVYSAYIDKLTALRQINSEYLKKTTVH